MNLYFVHRDGSIVTPELTGTILEGVTRSSILELAEELGHPVKERRISIEEWREGAASGDITEVFACGTAAVVTPGRAAWPGTAARCGRGTRTSTVASARSPPVCAGRCWTCSTDGRRTPAVGSPVWRSFGRKIFGVTA